MKYFLESEKKYRNIVLIVLLGMFALGTFLTLRYGNYFYVGDPELINNDDVKYLDTARKLLSDGKLYYNGVETVFIMPAYPLFIALIMKIFGTGDFGVTALRLTQLLLQCGAAYLIYLIAREIFNKRVAIISLIFTAFYLPEYVVANLALTECLFRFLYLTLFYLSIIAIKENKIKWYVLGGIAWAATCLVRPNAAAFPLFILIYWIVNKYTIKEMIKYTSIVAVVFCVMFSPWWIRNYNLKDKFILFTESSANPRLLGTLIRWGAPSFADEIAPEYKYKEFFEENIVLSEEEQTKLANEMLRMSFTKQPIRYTLWHTVGKTIELYRQPYYWKEILGIGPIEAQIEHYFYIVMGLLGFLVMIITKNKKSRMLMLFFAINTITYLPFITFDRYGYPNMFCFTIAAAYLFNILLGLRKNPEFAAISNESNMNTIILEDKKTCSDNN